MKPYLRLMGKLCPDINLSTIGDEPSKLSCLRSAMRYQLPAKFWLIPKAYYLITILLLVFVSCSAALAQEPVGHTAPAAKAETEITPLKIGDKIPDELWDLPLQVVNHPEGKEIITLNDYRDKKLIILDFWATWCSGCIKNFPIMETLQNDYRESTGVLAVSQENIKILNTFFNSKGGSRFKSLLSVSEDKLLNQYFPHRGIPYYIWIKDGVILSATDGQEVNSINVDKALDGEASHFPVVKMIDRKSRPLLLSEDFDKNLDLRNYSIFIKGEIRGTGAGTYFRYTDQGLIKGRQFSNLPMFDIFFAVANELFMKNGEDLTRKRIILDLKKPHELNYTIDSDGNIDGVNMFSYELNVPDNKTDSLYDFMLEGLGRYSDYVGTIEERLTKCLILKRTSTIDKIKTNGDEMISAFASTPSVLRNAPLSHMLNHLSVTKHRTSTD